MHSGEGLHRQSARCSVYRWLSPDQQIPTQHRVSPPAPAILPVSYHESVLLMAVETPEMPTVPCVCSASRTISPNTGSSYPCTKSRSVALPDFSPSHAPGPASFCCCTSVIPLYHCSPVSTLRGRPITTAMLVHLPAWWSRIFCPIGRRFPCSARQHRQQAEMEHLRRLVQFQHYHHRPVVRYHGAVCNQASQ